MLPGIVFINAPGIGSVPTKINNNATESSEIASGKPGVISEHSGTLLVSFIGTFIRAIPIPGAFLKSIPGKIFAFPMTAVCVWISATQLSNNQS